MSRLKDRVEESLDYFSWRKEELKTDDKYYIEALERKIEWYDLFVDYIHQFNRNDYNSACEYADSEEQLNIEL